ncbi:4'-phosphopantetheinyl transferase superfamily protein [Methylocella sp.]|uniref:4'-phosphopantetheinyl transferase family protein n=1 Tax=Methylocella sp. TaxID=1978226 RepID=UPI0035B03887
MTGEADFPPAGWREIAVRDARVKLWLIDAAPDPAALAAAARVLSEAERARAGRFFRLEDRARSMISRAALRRLLGAATGRAPESLVFGETEHGRPRLVGAQAPSFQAPSFNVSHSGGWALIGLSKHGDIGVDIEEARPDVEALDLARGFFHDGEYRAIAAREGAARLEAFYRVWTAKEAALKALGVGIAERLKDFEVRFAPDELRVIAEPGAFSPRLSTMRLEALAAPQGYAAACALA